MHQHIKGRKLFIYGYHNLTSTSHDVEIKLTLAIVLVMTLVIETIKVITMKITKNTTAFGGAVSVEDRYVSILQCCTWQ
jgi:hypothetical protein